MNLTLTLTQRLALTLAQRTNIRIRLNFFKSTRFKSIQENQLMTEYEEIQGSRALIKEK